MVLKEAFSTQRNKTSYPIFSSSTWVVLLFFQKFFLNIYLFLRDKERRSTSGGGAETERETHRIRSRLQALSCQHRAWCGAWTHEPWDHDLSQSWTLNWLSHPGIPWVVLLLRRCHFEFRCLIHPEFIFMYSFK